MTEQAQRWAGFAAANGWPGCRCQTQLIDESGREQPKKVPLVAEQEPRPSAGDGEQIQPHFASSDPSVDQNPGLLRSLNSRLRPGSPPSLPSPAAAAASVTALRTSGLMSASVPYPWPCGRVSLVCGLLLLASSPLLTAGRLSNCTHPLVPEHGGFRCEPSPCRGFPHKSSIHLFCEPGYHTKSRVSRCHHGSWKPPIAACILLKGSNMSSDDRVNDSMPSMATTAVGVSIFLLTTTACLVVKSRLFPCQSHSRRSSDQLDLMVDGLPVSLPSYEEAVYGSWGQRLPSCSAPGPTQLLLAQEAPSCHQSPQSDGSHHPLLSSQSPDNPPPPYEEVQSPHPRDRLSDGDVRQLHVALSDDKDT